MAALPGGDPLAAMLKAGEMPSPELVAASGRRGTLSLQRALQLGALIAVCVVPALWYFSTPSLDELIGGLLAPEVLAHQSGVLLKDLGYEVAAVDSAWGFDVDWSVFSRLGSEPGDEISALLLSAERPVLRFWYRVSPSPMAPWQGVLPGLYRGGVVTPEDPPLTVPGMALVRLGPRGDLIELRVVPDPVLETWAETTEGPIRAITAAAGLDPSTIEPIEWPRIGPMPGTSTVAWRVADNRSNVGFREIVATFAGDRVTWARVDPLPLTAVSTLPTQAEDRPALMFFVFFVVGSVVAGLNVRSGRWDRRGGLRLAVAAFVFCFVAGYISSHHPLNAGGEVRGFFSTVAYAGTRGLMTWVLYIAIEPFIRRYRPMSLVSWSRLLAGRITDPAVGRDVLIGLAVYAVQSIALVVAVSALGLAGWRLSGIAFSVAENSLSVASYLGSVIRHPIVTLGSSLGFLLTYVVARLLLGRFKIAAPLFLWATAFMLVHGAYGVAGQSSVVLAPLAAISATGMTYLAVRHGLLPLVVFGFISSVAMVTVGTLDPSDWFFPQAALLVALIVGLTIFGIKTSSAQHLMPSRP
jgi:serine/threonine-protein kinase